MVPDELGPIIIIVKFSFHYYNNYALTMQGCACYKTNLLDVEIGTYNVRCSIFAFHAVSNLAPPGLEFSLGDG